MNNENMTLHFKVKDLQLLAYELQRARKGSHDCRHYEQQGFSQRRRSK
jgi:hypothetical protein